MAFKALCRVQNKTNVSGHISNWKSQQRVSLKCIAYYTMEKLIFQRLSQMLRCCRISLFLLLTFALLDMTLCIPSTAYIIVNAASNETWLEQNSQLGGFMGLHMGLPIVFGFLALGFMTCSVRMQMAILIISRIFVCGILLELSVDADIIIKFVIWLNTAFSFVYMIGNGFLCILSMEKGARPYVGDNRDMCMIVMKTCLPAIVVTAVASAVYSILTEDTNGDFQLIYYALYVFGFVVLVTSSYFCTAYDMITHSKETTKYTVTTKDGKQYVTISPHEIEMQTFPIRDV